MRGLLFNCFSLERSRYRPQKAFEVVYYGNPSVDSLRAAKNTYSNTGEQLALKVYANYVIVDGFTIQSTASRSFGIDKWNSFVFLVGIKGRRYFKHFSYPADAIPFIEK